MKELPSAKEELVDCTDCGICCSSHSLEHIPILGLDHTFLTRAEQRDLMVLRGDMYFMRMVDGVCVNLVEQNGRYTCAIYERRPTACREYERAGPSCEADRERGHVRLGEGD